MDNSKNLVQYSIFSSFKNLFAFTTTRETIRINNVRYSSEPENKIILAEALSIPPERLVFPNQTHTNCVVDLNGISKVSLDNTDALVTNQKGLCICVQTADCVPILLFDPGKNVVSAVHAGWRGTVGKIVKKAVNKMVQNYGCHPDNLLAAIGPSISPEIYEVGNEVVEVAKKTIPNVAKALIKNNSEKFRFNLWEANRQLLLASGLSAKHIEMLEECSFLKENKYYSARREGVNTGRLVSGIMIKT